LNWASHNMSKNNKTTWIATIINNVRDSTHLKILSHDVIERYIALQNVMLRRCDTSDKHIAFGCLSEAGGLQKNKAVVSDRCRQDWKSTTGNQYLRLHKTIIATDISELVLSNDDLVKWFLETRIHSYGFRALLYAVQAVSMFNMIVLFLSMDDIN